jgi:hypothetical protein
MSVISTDIYISKQYNKVPGTNKWHSNSER